MYKIYDIFFIVSHIFFRCLPIRFYFVIGTCLALLNDRNSNKFGTKKEIQHQQPQTNEPKAIYNIPKLETLLYVVRYECTFKLIDIKANCC